jgi:hypothetical protein
MSTHLTNRGQSPLSSPLWLRLAVIALFTFAVGELAVVAHPYEQLNVPRIGPQTDHGWPLPAIRVTHDHSAEHLLIPERLVHFVTSLVRVGLLRFGLVYDLNVIALSCAAIWLLFRPWRAFPRPQFSLTEILVLLAFVSVGCVLWFRMWTAGSDLWQVSKAVLIANTCSYLIITLTYAGTLNGVLAYLSRPGHRQQT